MSDVSLLEEFCSYSHNIVIYQICMHASKLFQLCPTLCDPKDYSLPGSFVYEILQARILEWFSKPSSRGSSWPRDQTRVSYLCLLRWQVGSLPLSTTWKAHTKYLELCSRMVWLWHTILVQKQTQCPRPPECTSGPHMAIIRANTQLYLVCKITKHPGLVHAY